MLPEHCERGRRFLSLGPARNGDVNPVGTMEALCDTLLSSRGEASGMGVAKNILDRWQGFDQDKRRDFMLALLSLLGPISNGWSGRSTLSRRSDAEGVLENEHRRQNRAARN